MEQWKQVLILVVLLAGVSFLGYRGYLQYKKFNPSPPPPQSYPDPYDEQSEFGDLIRDQDGEGAEEPAPAQGGDAARAFGG